MLAVRGTCLTLAERNASYSERTHVERKQARNGWSAPRWIQRRSRPIRLPNRAMTCRKLVSDTPTVDNSRTLVAAVPRHGARSPSRAPTILAYHRHAPAPCGRRRRPQSRRLCGQRKRACCWLSLPSEDQFRLSICYWIWCSVSSERQMHNGRLGFSIRKRFGPRD